MYKGTFSMISYSKSMYKDFFEIYIFYIDSKGFFNDFFVV